jgi:hypothetical protein
MLIDPHTWSQHRPWATGALAIALGATGWYFYAGHGPAVWPGGSSLPGFTFGVAGGLIILFEMLLWWRKKVRTWRIGRTQTWLRAHIWLGLLSVPLLVYHSGFQLGGSLSTVLMILFLIVIASGIWGLALQQFLPRRMLDTLPAETIYSQIDRAVDELCREADRLVLATCGAWETDPLAVSAAVQEEPGPQLVIGAVRSAGQVQGRVVSTRVPPAPVPDTESLRAYFESDIRPYLRVGSASGAPFQYGNRAAELFRDLKTKLPTAAHETVDALAELCEQRRQFDAQIRLHFWLHNWLWIHLPLSAALVILMFVHVWVALKYW